jgi:prevent-host-death family protein
MDDKSRLMSLRDANQNFAACVREVADTGREIVITRHGVPVAKLGPIDADAKAERAAARKRLRAQMETGLDIGYRGPLDRASLYDRDR